MADASLPPMQAVKIDADPAGDLVLVVGPSNNQRSIRASSKVLSLASPVLAAMFSPQRFSEGTKLSTSDPPEICLPDDDPEAVTAFCNVVHFREYSGQQRPPSLNQLVSIAVLCDKYDAGLALNYRSELWLHHLSVSEASRDYRNLLALAYAFNNQEHFWISSRNAMQYHVAECENGIIDELLPLLPNGLFGKPFINP